MRKNSIMKHFLKILALFLAVASLAPADSKGWSNKVSPDLRGTDPGQFVYVIVQHKFKPTHNTPTATTATTPTMTSKREITSANTAK
jgi:hypothetical protein